MKLFSGFLIAKREDHSRYALFLVGQCESCAREIGIGEAGSSFGLSPTLAPSKNYFMQNIHKVLMNINELIK